MIYRVFFFLWFALFFQPNINATQLPPGYAEELIVEGIDPTRMAISPDGRIFLAQKNGTISIVKDGQLLDDPFLQISVDNYNERGLTGMVLDPDFESNNYFYLYYTVLNDNKNRVSRFTANGDYVVPGSEMILLELEELGGTIHNGGDMVFASDGTMFVAIGDGSYGHLPQDTSSLFGKILRINPDGTIPTDNPFYDRFDGINRSIYAIGFRNPFTIAYDKDRELLYANDVGSSEWEELVNVNAGMNYGWPIIEGPFVSGEKPENYRDAVFNYPHTNDYCAIIGADFYNPDQSNFDSKYLNKYFVGDYCKGNIRVFNPETELIEEEFASEINRPISIKHASNGDLYYLARGGIGGGSEEDNTSSLNGKLYRIYYIGEGIPFIISNPKDVLHAIGETAQFNVVAGGNGEIKYQWFVDGVISLNDTLSTLKIEDVQLSQDGSEVYCEISIDDEILISELAILNVTVNTRPVVSISKPEINSMYEAGQLISFEGFAVDDEDGNILSQNLSWKVDFHHDDHTHPFLSDHIGESGTILIPSSGEISTNVWLRFYLTARDLEGFSKTEYVDVYPNQSSFTVSTIPEGLKVSVDGKIENTPNTSFSVVGIQRTIRAPLLQQLDGDQYVFEAWDDGYDNPLIGFVKSEEEESFVAIYNKIDQPKGTGLMGAYQNFNVFTGEENGDVIYQLDSIVNFDWQEGSPIPGSIDIDNFKVTWRGFLTPIIDDEYGLYVTMDDGARLKVDGEVLIDHWENGPKRERSNSIFLEGQRRYHLELEYYESGGGALASLAWSSKLINKQVIPKKFLTPEPIPGSSTLDIFPRVIYNQNELGFVIESIRAAEVEWNICQQDGKVLMRGQNDVNNGINIIDINYEELIPGHYFFNISSEEEKPTGTGFIIPD